MPGENVAAFEDFDASQRAACEIAIVAIARQLDRAATQDMIRARRQQARSRRFALHC